jgi:hypothetical protein
MRRLISAIQRGLIITGSVILSAESSAQPVDFANDRTFVTAADRLVRDVFLAPLVGTNYVAQLYYGPEGASADSLLPVTTSPAQFRATTTTIPGTWRGGYRTLAGLMLDQTATLQVRVWDSTVGASWEEAVAAGFGGTQYGTSALFSYRIPVTGSPQLYYIENFRGFTLVPEPATAMLVLAGLFAWTLMRRKGNCSS